MNNLIRKAFAALIAMAIIFTLQMPYAGAAGLSLTKISESQIGEGTFLLKYNLVIGGKSSNVFVTRADLNNPYVEVGPVYGTQGKLTARQNVKKMADEKGAIAAVNADFFRMDRRGAPFGIVMDKGKLVSSMGKINNWYSFGLLNDKTAIVSHMTFNGSLQTPDGATAVIQGVNKEEYNPTNDKSHLNKINLYTSDFGTTSLGAIKGYEDSVEMLVMNDQVSAIQAGKPGMAIPQGGYVLWGHGTGKQFLMSHLKIGDAVTTTLQTGTDISIGDKQLYNAVGGHMLLVKEGKALTNIPSNSIGGNQPRTAFGISKDGKTVYMAVVEGPTKSRGVTLDELAQLMSQLGAYNAANFDGGGSSTMVARTLGNTQTSVLNTPKLGEPMRSVPTGLAFFNTAPPGELANFFFTNDNKTVLGRPLTMTVAAYDTHYNPYKLDPASITWTAANPADGTFNKNVFTPKRSGTIQVTGQYNGMAKTMNLSVTDPEITDIYVSSASFTLHQNETVNFNVSLKPKTGSLLPAAADQVKVSLTPGLGTVNGFSITAGDVEKAGELVLTYKNITKRIPVTVGTKWVPWNNMDSLTGLSYATVPDNIAGDGSFRQTVEGEPVKDSSKAVRLDYNFAGASNANTRIAYGRLGAAPVVLPGKPIGMKVWAYGDGKGHWLRAELLDANQKVYYVDLANETNWTDWKELEGKFPAGVAYPVSLRSLYVVDREDSTLEPQGTVYFDEISLEQPVTFANPAPVPVPAPTPAPVPTPTPVPLPTAPAGVKFTDIKGHWAEEVLLSMYNKGIVHGVSQTKLGPNLPVTRGQFVTFMDNAYGWSKAAPASGKLPFKDSVPGYAQAAVLAAANKGIVTGMPDGTFQADKPITRTEMAAMVHKAMVKGYGDLSVPVRQRAKLKDAGSVPSYASDSVNALYVRGYMNGDDKGYFNPKKVATRAEALSILYNVLQK
jgi:hypothetical protein